MHETLHLWIAFCAPAPLMFSLMLRASSTVVAASADPMSLSATRNIKLQIPSDHMLKVKQLVADMNAPAKRHQEADAEREEHLRELLHSNVSQMSSRPLFLILKEALLD